MSAKPEVRVGVRELRRDLTHYLNEARAGASILVTSHDEVVAELRAPPPELLPPRRPGRLKGKIWMAEDFDTWPNDILASFEEWKLLRLLLDTHVVLWWINDSPRLRADWREMILRPTSEVWVSVATLGKSS